MRTIGGRRNRTNDCLGLGLQVALVDTVKARSQVGEVIRVATAGLAQHLMIIDLCEREKVGLKQMLPHRIGHSMNTEIFVSLSPG